MNREIVTAIKSREVGERLAALGYDAAASLPEQLAEHVKVELARYGRLIKAIGFCDKADPGGRPSGEAGHD